MAYREQETAVLVVAFNGWLIGVDPATGKERWEHHLGGSAIRLLVAGDRIYAANQQSLHAFAYPSGEVLWRVAVSGGDTMMLVGDRIYLGSAGVIECVTADGRALFRNNFPGKGHGPVAFALPGESARADRDT